MTVRNNSLHNASGNGGLYFHDSGIYFNNVRNGTVENNSLEGNNYYGIYLSLSNRNILINNYISKNSYGISLYVSHNNIIKNNNASDNDLRGVDLYWSNSNYLAGNVMYNDGLTIDGCLIENWNTHTILSTNLVNGKPIYYFKNQTSGVVPSDAGQVILANASGMTISNLKTNNEGIGIELGFSSNNMISNNNASDNLFYGIYLVSSGNNNIVNNNASNNKQYGIYLNYFSGSNTVANNSVTKNLLKGIYLMLSNSNIIRGNYVFGTSGYGIHTSDSSKFNHIHNNNFISNNGIGGKDACDTSGSNFWNDTTRGNYWGDYDTPAEGCWDNDINGICDASYLIDGGIGAKDFYPITTPVVHELNSGIIIIIISIILCTIIAIQRKLKCPEHVGGTSFPPPAQGHGLRGMPSGKL